MIHSDSIPVRLDIPWRNIDGNAIVVQPKEGVLYPLNSVATRIWILSDGTRNVEEIVAALISEFEGEPDEIRKDSLLFLEALEKVSLIKTGQAEQITLSKKGS